MRMWVLQIDDDEDDLEFFSTAVRLFDPAMKYSGVGSMKSALLLFDAEGCAIPDFMVLDINMPRHSGFDCYTIFKKDPRFINTRFIFVSTTIHPREIPAGCASMKKQHSLKSYVSLISKHLPPTPPPTNSSYADANYKYRPCVFAYDHFGLRLQPSASQFSTSDEMTTLHLQ
jgi:CheY-like chemotaxis protein